MDKSILQLWQHFETDTLPWILHLNQKEQELQCHVLKLNVVYRAWYVWSHALCDLQDVICFLNYFHIWRSMSFWLYWVCDQPEAHLLRIFLFWGYKHWFEISSAGSKNSWGVRGQGSPHGINSRRGSTDWLSAGSNASSKSLAKIHKVWSDKYIMFKSHSISTQEDLPFDHLCCNLNPGYVKQWRWTWPSRVHISVFQSEWWAAIFLASVRCSSSKYRQSLVGFGCSKGICGILKLSHQRTQKGQLTRLVRTPRETLEI